jgi:HD-GYP domain-containing protein (c-di-GMP phosphodiesterase class II)
VVAPPKTPAGGPERQIIARLIRRLRISDPPERFQQMATNALRTALNVQAVAWVPCHYFEPVLVNGVVGRLKGEGYRSLIPGAHHKEPTLVANEPRVDIDPELRRTAAASADTQGSVGWLVAINPLDGRLFNDADVELLQPVAAMIACQQQNARGYSDLKELLFGVIRALTAAIDAKDPYTSGHSERVARIAVRLAEELGMSPNQRGDLYLMGLLHDVGKIGVDDAVLKKPGPLTPEEYRQIQAHVEIGVHILTDLKKLNHLLPGVRHHHESLDGTGYPCGLAGDAIPWEARILAVADSFDAMSSTRPYRRKLSPTQIDEILRKGSGVQWDPKIVDALFASRMDLELIRQKGLGESLQLAVSETLGRA